MNRIHLVTLWHMHQPQYRDPSNNQYVLPWTRLHALKDYWGMVKVLEEFPHVHATFNLVPALVAQLEEYASGKFDEPWFRLAFAPAESLKLEERREVLDRAFQANRDTLIARWPRYLELAHWVQGTGADAIAGLIGLQDLRDVQMFSQLAWMDEEYLAHDPVVSKLARKGADFTEEDKRQLRAKQLELLARVLPEYRAAAERGQIEISTTPFYHPILPLLCDTDIAHVSNPYGPLLNPAFRNPGDAREQLVRARAYHERVFGQPPAGLWPSEGSVSDQVLEIAAELGFRWFATDEGVLGRTLNVGFWRDPSGLPESASQLYTPWRFRRGGREIAGIFRDHYLSDLVGFVYTRMDQGAAAEDLHRRIRVIGERVSSPHPVTVGLILDGENAWEYYSGNGREFFRQFYRRIEADSDIRALTVSEALAASGKLPTLEGIFPASWINANFDIWIGHAEDIRAWELLRDAREAYDEAVKLREEKNTRAPSEAKLAKAYESVLAAEGSDWCWWFGPEHGTPNDAEFDALYRKHLTEIYVALGKEPPDVLAQPIKRPAERARAIPPAAYLVVKVDGRETSYFEWLGAGYYSSNRRFSAMHGRACFLGDFHYGFSEKYLYLRLDPLPKALEQLRDCELRLTIQAGDELRIIVRVREGRMTGQAVERNDVCLLPSQAKVSVALDKMLEIAVPREILNLTGQRSLRIAAALWQGGLPIDVVPSEGSLEVQLGEESFSWPYA